MGRAAACLAGGARGAKAAVDGPRGSFVRMCVQGQAGVPAAGEATGRTRKASVRMAIATALDRSDIPLYRQLDAILRDQIAGGQMQPGDRLPTETELCAQYGVSRATVRQALEALEADGLIERTAGRGTFLRALPPPRGPAAGRSRIAWDVLSGRGAARMGTELRYGSAVPPAVVARELRLDPGVETPFFIRVLIDAAGPRAGLKRYVRPDLKPLLTRRLRTAADFPAALARAAGAPVACARFWAEAILAEPRFAMILKAPLGSPVLSLWWTETLAGAPAICSQMLQPGAEVAVELGR
jgi:GntR family transcriptional regulator